jgi:ankyrin repeat protein
VLSYHTKTIDIVLAKSKDINISLDKEKNTAAHLAVQFGLIDLLPFLLSRGADFTQKNAKELTPFHLAIIQDDDEMLEELLKLVKQENWPTDLYELAQKYSKSHCLQLLKKKLGDKNTSIQVLNSSIENISQEINEESITELQQALEKIDAKKFKILLSKLPVNLIQLTDKQGQIPLLHAAFLSISPDWAVKALSEVNAKLNVKDNHGFTILHYILRMSEKHARYSLTLIDTYFANDKKAFLQEANWEELFYLATQFGTASLFIDWLEDTSLLLDYQTKTGDTLLHIATRLGNVALVEKLLKLKLKVNATNNARVTPLMLAAETGNDYLVQLLLANNADPDQQDIYQNTALHHALLREKFNVASSLIPVTHKLNTRNRQGHTPQMLATKPGALPVLKLLVSTVGKLSTEIDKNGFTILHLAAFNNQSDIIHFIMEKENLEIDVSQKLEDEKENAGLTPLQVAAHEGKLEAFKTLISLGADPFKLNYHKKCAIDYAISSNQYEIMQFIYSLKVFVQKESVTEFIMTTAQENNLSVLIDFYNNGQDLNIHTKTGRSLLHLASINNADKIAEFLIREGFDLEQSAFNGNRPIHDAAFYESITVLKQLCDAKVNLNSQNQENKTALHLACEKGHYAAVVQLVKSGAKLNINDNEGFTPIQWAIKNNFSTIVKFLQEEQKNKEEKREKLEYIQLGAMGVGFFSSKEQKEWSKVCIKNGGSSLVEDKVGAGYGF